MGGGCPSESLLFSVFAVATSWSADKEQHLSRGARLRFYPECTCLNAPKTSELSGWCQCLSFGRCCLLACGGGSGLDTLRAARPPEAPLQPSVKPTPASQHGCLSPCESGWCQSGPAPSVPFRGSVSSFGEGVLSDGYGGDGL